MSGISGSQAANTVLFADPSALEDLCIISVSVSGIVPATSRFQIQTIKCREIIFTEPDVIASPSIELDSVFHVIVQISLYKTGRLQARFQKLGLEVSKPSYVTPSQYQSCLRYTLLAKLAPNWNKAGPWLVQGRDFLTSAGYVNGIKLEVSVTSGELYFTVDASTVRFPSLKLEDLDIPATCYNNFLQNQSAVIHHHMIPMVWCHILPSMKKGTIVSISHSLPNDGPFRSYKEIKRHWKNHYGYRLPEDEDDMLYYQINFRPLGEKLFTYPGVCLRARDIQRVPRVDPKPILITFLQDLQKKMPKICGFPLKLHNKAHYPTLDLEEVTQVVKKTNQNLSSKCPNRKVIYRNGSDIERLVSQTAISRGYFTQPTQENISCSMWQDLSISSQLPQSHTPGSQYRTQSIPDFSQHGNTDVRQQKSIFTEGHVDVQMSCGNECDNLNHSSTQQVPIKKIVPVFKPSIYSHSSQKVSGEQSQNQKIVPVFQKSKPVKLISQASEVRTNPTSEVSQTTETSCKEQNRHIQVPMFSTRKTHNEPTKTVKSGLSTGHMKNDFAVSQKQNMVMKPKDNLIEREKFQNNCTLSNASGLSASRNSKGESTYPSNGSVRTTIPASSCLQTLSSVDSTNSGKDVFAPPSTPKFQKPIGLVLATPKSTMKIPIPSTPKSIIKIPSTPKSCKSTSSTPYGTPAMKRPMTSNRDGTPSVKKPRPKQQVQDIDVENLARSNQLNKVNTVTLINWLKERGASCKSKDKKGDLIEKALKLLNLSVSEQ